MPEQNTLEGALARLRSTMKDVGEVRATAQQLQTRKHTFVSGAWKNATRIERSQPRDSLDYLIEKDGW